MADVPFEDVMCKAETTKAILVEIGGEDFWIPQNQISDESEVWREGDEGTLIITDWLAMQKGLL